ncbi:hypothetical protein AJ78_04454 [Emergomyces pasteurianus Ep9510]|uniref:tRNA-splicing endonuclease subunit Sen15 domain-containing protein n=1 Tax=Emergomyces pasteurianus Ep9510 TaxID=1447872 RepID=A0A1J9QJ84_9EURO|nr:hypothetical protein AJ78_04454 [Emergomyces pasteurianus Ep9510]
MPTPTTTTLSTPPPSALTTLTTPTSQNPIASLTTQILHNLQHQHGWIALHIHEPHTLSPTQRIPLISGLPPQTLYTHPDEQAYMLEQGISMDDVPTEREWVIPTAQGQAWSLRMLAECFDALPLPDSKHHLDTGAEAEAEAEVDVDINKYDDGVGIEAKSGAVREKRKKGKKQSQEELFAEYSRRKRGKEWGGKRALVAMVNRGMGGDGTVVYYVVLEGSVKPRQN